MKYCKKCIMPETFPGIIFNEQDICNYCSDYKTLSYLGEDELVKLVNSVKKNSKYDCVIPLSGGKDSTFILYYAAKKLKLKAIAVNYNSGMQSDLAISNMNNACNTLKVPLIIKNANKELQNKRLVSLVLLQKRAGEFIYGCGDCVPALQAITIKYANENNIPMLFDGGSLIEHVPESNKKNKIPSKIASLLKYKMYNLDFIKYIYFIRYSFYNKLLNKELGVGSVSVPPFGYKYYFDCGITKVIRFSSYVSLSDTDKINILSKELNWQNPKEKDKRFDCMLHCLSDIGSIRKYGITSNGIVYSNMIREGLMTREEAVQKEDYAKQNLNAEYKTLLNKLGL